MESLFNKVAGLQATNFIKKRLQHKCFPVNTAKFLRTPSLKEGENDKFLRADLISLNTKCSNLNNACLL